MQDINEFKSSLLAVIESYENDRTESYGYINPVREKQIIIIRGLIDQYENTISLSVILSNKIRHFPKTIWLWGIIQMSWGYSELLSLLSEVLDHYSYRELYERSQKEHTEVLRLIEEGWAYRLGEREKVWSEIHEKLSGEIEGLRTAFQNVLSMKIKESDSEEVVSHVRLT